MSGDKQAFKNWLKNQTVGQLTRLEIKGQVDKVNGEKQRSPKIRAILSLAAAIVTRGPGTKNVPRPIDLFETE